MIKGCEKRIYYTKNTGGKYFEEAYLVLRRDISDDGCISESYAGTDMAKEAERIIREAADAYMAGKKRKGGAISRGMSFLLGAASSSAVIGIAALIVGLS